MSRPPYFRPYGAQAFTRAVSASARILVPRFWRIYLALWLIRRWRLPATPILILPVAVSLKRFLTPLLVLSLGIFVSLCAPRFRGGRRYPTATACLLAGPSVFQRSGKGAPIEGRCDSGKGSSSPRDGRSVIAEEATRIVEPKPLDHPAHAGDAVLRLERRRRSAHARLDPARVEHCRDHVAPADLERKVPPGR